MTEETSHDKNPAVPVYGPLGPGHEPVKDPLKGLRGVMAGVLVMESISIFLVLTVIAKVDEGAHWSLFNGISVTVIGVAFFILAFLMKYQWANTVNWVLQGLAFVVGVIVHWSMAIMVFVFIAVWFYVRHLRMNLIERMRRGLLTTQHS